MNLENIIDPITINCKIIIKSYYIVSVIVKLFRSVEINLIFVSDIDKSYERQIILCDELYTQWGSDDDYLTNYIKNNLETIINI